MNEYEPRASAAARRVTLYHQEVTIAIAARVMCIGLRPAFQGLSQIFGRFTPHRPEEPVLGKPKAQHRLFTAVREIPSLLSS